MQLSPLQLLLLEKFGPVVRAKLAAQAKQCRSQRRRVRRMRCKKNVVKGVKLENAQVNPPPVEKVEVVDLTVKRALTPPPGTASLVPESCFKPRTGPRRLARAKKVVETKAEAPPSSTAPRLQSACCPKCSHGFKVAVNVLPGQ